MQRLMDMSRLRVATLMVLVAALSSSCTADHSTSEDAAKVAGSPSPAVHTSKAQQLCEVALHRRVAASSATVEEVHAFTVGGPTPLTPDPSRRPARAAFPASSLSDSAAWCTVATTGTLTFYAAGPDGTAVRLEAVNGYSGAVPDHPLAIP
jgi:hypothetical protein